MIRVYLNNLETTYLLVSDGRAWWLDTKRSPSTIPDSKSWWTSDVHYAVASCNYLFNVNNVNDIEPLRKMEKLMDE